MDTKTVMDTQQLEQKEEFLEENFSLEQIILTTEEIAENYNAAEKLLGSYICKLIYSENPLEYFVTHPVDTNYLVPLRNSSIDINSDLDGAEVLVVFDGGDSSKPIVTGIIKKVIKAKDLNPTKAEVIKDRQDSLVFEADREIVLKCGKSSITLTRAGKVLIKGAYLLSRSSGANRIKGGSVHLN
ncbi:MAG: hypothetical protein OEM38_05530 [Gammaproteobacteria bacterium]|nr:hypothetical protein [Gammaproteobacteria bacterium]